MDINCGMELQFSEASNLTEPDFTTTGSGLTVNMESSTDDVRTLLDSVTSTCTSTAYRGHYQNDRHLTAADFKLDLGPANDLVSATDLSMENSVTDISDSMMTSEECSDGYSIVNAALEGNIAPLKPQVISSSNGNAVNLGGIPIATVLSGIQAIPVIPITNLENIQLCSDGKLVKLNELSLVSNDNRLLLNDQKNSLNGVGQSAILLGNVLMLHPGIMTQVNAEGSGVVQNKAFVSSLENENISQKGTQECTGPTTTVENGHVSQKVTREQIEQGTVENGNASQQIGQEYTKQRTVENGNASQQIGQEYTKQRTVENGNASQQIGQEYTKQRTVENGNASQQIGQEYTKQRTVENGNASQQVGQEYTKQRIMENGNASQQVDQEYIEQRTVENGNISQKVGQVGSDKYVTTDITQSFSVNNQPVLNSISSVEHSFNSDSLTTGSNVLNIDNTMTLKKSDLSHSSDMIPGDPLEKTKIMTCGKTIYLTFDCKNHSKSLPKSSTVSIGSGSKVSVDTHVNNSGLRDISETRELSLLSSPVSTPSEHLCRNTQLSLIGNQTTKNATFPSTNLISANCNVAPSLRNQASGGVLTEPHNSVTSVHLATSTGSIYSNCSRFPLTTNLKNSAVQVLATQGNSATTVSASRLNKPLFSPSLVQKNSDTVAATCVSSPSLNQFSAPFVTETHSNLVSGSKELTSDISSECHTTLTFAVPANQSQVSESTNQNLNFLTANSLKVSVPERKSTNQQTFQNNVVSGDQPMKNQLMIPVSVPTCQSSVSANQVPLSTNYVQLPLTVNQVSELISANKIKVPVSSNQLTVSLPINQSTVSVSTNQITVPLPINQTMIPVSANQKTASVPANQITVPVSTNQIVVPLSASNQTLPISTQLLVANKPTVLVSTNKNSNVALSTTCTNGTSPIVSASHVKVPVSVNKLSVPVLTNKSKPPVSRTQLKTPVSSELACLTTPLLVNQLTTPGSTNPLKLNCNALSLNQKRIPVSNQLSIPVSSQFVIPVTPNISAVESTNLTSKTTLRSSPQYKPSEGTLISSNQNRISGSSAGVQTACNTTSSSAIPTSVVIHSVNDCVIDPVTTSKKSTVSSSLLHCSQVQPSLTFLSDRLVQMDTQIINQSNQTKAGKGIISNTSTYTTDNQNNNFTSSDQLQNQQKCLRNSSINIESSDNQGKITLPTSSKLMSNLDIKQDSQELIIVPQTESSNYISILGTVKKQKLSTAESSVMLCVKKMESQNPKPRHTDCNEGSEDEKLNSSVVNFLSSNIEGVIDQQNLDTHLVLLDDPKPFKCDLCSAAFNRMGNYTRHRMIHTVNTKDSYRYKCEECGRLFLQRCDMRRHMLIHSNQEPYRCQECGKGYIRRSDLVVHMRFHRKERAFKCGRCGKEFFQSGDLNRHIRHVHLQSSLLTCGHCNRQFAKEATLIRHIQMKHRDIIIKSLKKTNVNKESNSKETCVKEMKEDEAMNYHTVGTVNTEVT